MKKDLIFGLGLYAVLFLVACSAEHHLRKFHDKGGEITPSIQLVEFTDTIKVNGKDSIIVVKIPVTCPDVKVPEPKWRTKLIYKYDWKKFNKEMNTLKSIYADSLKEARKIIQSKNKTQYKTVKAENKPSRWHIWLIIGFVGNWVVRVVWFYARSRTKY
jgi:hypothetical protein